MHRKVHLIIIFAGLLLGASCVDSILKVSHYDLQVVIDVQEQAYQVDVGIVYDPTKFESTDSLEFILHENAILSKCTAKGLSNYREVPGSNQSKYIRLFFDQAISEPVVIQFGYRAVLKPEDAPWGIDKIATDWIELSLNSSWLPIHSSYNLQFTAEVNLQIVANQSYQVISSGVTNELGDNRFSISNPVPHLDLVLIASRSFHESKEGAITIYDHRRNPERAAFMMAVGIASYHWLNEMFGEKNALPPVKLVITPRKESGYARKNFIILNDGISVEDTLGFVNFITHEFAHFWSSGANPLTPHRWLDESIAEYIAWKYIQKEYDSSALTTFMTRVEKEAPKLPPVYLPEHTGPPQHAVMYRKGVGKLFALEKMIGEEAMFTFLREWFANSQKDSETLLRILAQLQGDEVADQFRLALSQ